MPVKDYNTDPDMNFAISGINIAEGCPPSGINNAIRQLMADVKVEADAQAAKDAEQYAAISAVQTAAEEAQTAAEEAQTAAETAQTAAETAQTTADSKVAFTSDGRLQFPNGSQLWIS